MIQEFKCPACGTGNNVDLSPGQTRKIKCISCFGDVWTLTTKFTCPSPECAGRDPVQVTQPTHDGPAACPNCKKVPGKTVPKEFTQNKTEVGCEFEVTYQDQAAKG